MVYEPNSMFFQITTLSLIQNEITLKVHLQPLAASGSRTSWWISVAFYIYDTSRAPSHQALPGLWSYAGSLKRDQPHIKCLHWIPLKHIYRVSLPTKKKDLPNQYPIFILTTGQVNIPRKVQVGPGSWSLLLFCLNWLGMSKDRSIGEKRKELNPPPWYHITQWALYKKQDLGNASYQGMDQTSEILSDIPGSSLHFEVCHQI